MERYVVIDQYCGWPKLLAMPDGSLLMSAYNKPSHGGLCGEAECWRSEDGGRSFRYAGAPIAPDPSVSQMNDCLGLAHNGDVLEAFMSYRAPRRGPVLTRSSDGGRSFRVISEEVPADGIPGTGRLAMFGHMARVPNGHTLALACWTRSPDDPQDFCQAYACFSDDDGATWPRAYPVGDPGRALNNETALHFFDEREGIAVCRTSGFGVIRGRDEQGGLLPLAPCERFHYNECLTQYRTQDGGRSWTFEGAITGAQSHPANLIALKDGGLLLTYGCRFKPFSFICAQYSASRGLTWEAPQVLAMYESCDGGYPSSAQNPDGSICTVYYAQASAYHTHYHVASVVWRPEEMIGDAMVELDGLGVPSFVKQGTGLFDAKPEDILTPNWQFLL